MKSKDLISTIIFLEKKYNVKFTSIDLVDEDFLSIASELNITTGELYKHFTINGILIFSIPGNKILTIGRATFNVKNVDFNQIKEGLIFTTEEILSDEERLIKELLE